MELIDSRRLTGANLLMQRPGAVIDARLDAGEAGRAIEAWRTAARQLLEAVGWGDEEIHVRACEEGASLAISAPLDALYAATDVNERAFEVARDILEGDRLEVDATSDASATARLSAAIAEEANPDLLALRTAALERGVCFLSDDDYVSAGMGAGSITWPARELPPPDQVDWERLHDVPTALITGTNGKTTTARLLAAIVAAAGRTPGVTSTDWLRVGDEVLEEGDWSGPGGARRVLRDHRTEVGVLETARGGMARRGLALERADVACVLNVGEDHLGEWGVGTLANLADGKMVVTRVAPVCVLNADDPYVAERGAMLDSQVAWFGLDPERGEIRAHLGAGGRAALFDGERLYLARGDGIEGRRELLPAAGVPIAMGGAARYNVANALAAAAIADELGLGLDAIRAGLGAFASTPETNPGRLNEFDLGGVRVLVDFAHNPHGQIALLDLVQRLPHERLLLLLGQAGDRDDASIREMVRITWEGRPDMIVVKELTEHLRGRPPGEIPDLIEDELDRAGAPREQRMRAASELEAVRMAIEWARPGDLLLLLAHDKREEILAQMRALRERGWTPGSPIESA